MTKKVKKQHTLYSVLGIIGDIILYPVIVISLISSLVMFVSRRQNVAPNFFGVSLAYVASESMVKSGFLKGDVVFVARTNSYSLSAKTDSKNGDIIAFYNFSDKGDPTLEDLPYEDEDRRLTQVADGVTLSAPQNVTAERTEVKNLPKTTKIVFHEIVGRYVDEEGTLFFRTKGSSNNYEDPWLVRADLVIGKYVNTPVWLRAIFRFCSSQIGMICIVVVPLGILILFQCFSLIEQANNMMIEKNVIKRKIRYDSEDSKKANVGMEMNLVDKVGFYALTVPEEKSDVKEFLWGHLNQEKTKDEYDFVKRSVRAYKRNPTSYWKMWRLKIKGKKNLQKFEKYWQEWNEQYENNQSQA